jgi:hypothetical protein
MRNLVFWSVLFGAVFGCTWVNLTEAGQDVQIGYAGDVKNCQMLGTVAVTTQSKVLVERGTSTVQNELYTLARNQAGPMGATNLLPHTLPEEGAQAFSAYRCPRISAGLAGL